MFNKKGNSNIEPGPGERPVLFRVIPPKSGEFSAQGFINALEALNLVDEVLSLELCATDGQVKMYVRSTRPDHVLSALRSHYAQARFETVSPEEDPLLMPEDEWNRLSPGTLARRRAVAALPGAGRHGGGRDPFVDMLAGLSSEMPPGGRVVTRVLLSERDRDWSERWRNQAIAGSGSANQLAVDAMRREESGSGAVGQKGDGADTGGQFLQLLLIVIGMAALVAFVYLRHTFISIWNEHRVELFAYGALGLLALAGLGYLLHRTGILGALFRSRFFRGSPKPRFYDPDQVRLRVSGAAFRLEVQLYALLGDGRRGCGGDGAGTAPGGRLLPPLRQPDGRALCGRPTGEASRVRPCRGRPGLPGRAQGDSCGVRRSGRGSWARGRRQRSGTFREMPWTCRAWRARAAGGCRFAAGDVRAGGRAYADGAALIGVEAYGDGGLRKLHIPPEAMRRSGLIVARTGMGKTTLTQHIARSLLRDRAAGTGDAALVVVDPHSDLVLDILNGMPVGAAADVRLVDLGDETRACGLNLLDTRTFPARDLTVETVLTVARSSSRNWGDRMEEILRWTLYALYEANRNRKAARAVHHLRRHHVPHRREQATGDHTRGPRQGGGRRDRAAVVERDIPAAGAGQRPPGARACASQAGAVRGQQERAQGAGTAPHHAGHRGHHPLRQGLAGELGKRAQTGPEVSSIVGGAILNLLNHIAKQQSRLEPHERRRVVIIVDEMQVFPGVPFDEMLSELRKFGGSLLMATQSLGRLNEMTESGNMGETILANPGSLFSFQVNASDAELLHKELESDVIEENDIVELPPHHCYGRLTLESGNIHFSMEVLPPMPGNTGIAELIRQASDAYTRPTAEVDAENAAYMQGKYREYFGDLDDGDPDEQDSDDDPDDDDR